jgi:hypothetical protein
MDAMDRQLTVVPLTKNDDWECVRLSTHPEAPAIVERPRESPAVGAGVSSDDVRRRLVSEPASVVEFSARSGVGPTPRMHSPAGPSPRFSAPTNPAA